MLDDNDNPSEIPETLEPAETDPASPYSRLNSKKLHDAALRALDHYLSPPPSKPKLADRRPSSIFIIAPNVDKESLLAHCCGTLASASVIASELAFSLTGPQCNMALAIQQMISLAELSVNRVLDQVDPQE